MIKTNTEGDIESLNMEHPTAGGLVHVQVHTNGLFLKQILLHTRHVDFPVVAKENLDPT